MGCKKKFSFVGWDLTKWVRGNKEAIKIITGALVSLSVLYPEVFVINLTVGAGAIVVKALIDVVDFWSSEVKL